MNIDELEAGRELDALVAEEVMGWKLVNYDTYKPATTPEDYRDAATNDGWMWNGRCGTEEAWKWRPSTSIADAWEVVDYLLSTDRFSCFDLQYDHADSPVVPKTLPWYVIFIPFNEEADWCSGEADTRALAICRAALKAAEGEK